ALGGIITHPMISWLAESGPEAVVPLTDKSRGIPLLMEAGRRLGMPDNAWNMIVEAPDIGQKLNIAAHATGGIFSTPHIGLVAESGPEAVVPLSDRSRGIPLWLAAGEEMGMNFMGGNTVSNYTGGSSISNSYSGGSPTINITVNGGGDDRGLAQRIAQAVRDALSDIQSYEERVAFA
ncbi:MAG: hypothetical protein K5841_09355, partial [Fretibacterium sp.]|nr:hypothetical protein [Fretibacterium sp.]